MATMAQIVECPRHPGVETALQCSRCEVAICPSCLVQTPVGARCRDCARIKRTPMYVLSTAHLLRAGVAAVVGGIAMGLVWALILLPFTFGFFSIFIGAGLGYVFTRLMEFATGGKRGPAVVGACRSSSSTSASRSGDSSLLGSPSTSPIRTCASCRWPVAFRGPAPILALRARLGPLVPRELHDRSGRRTYETAAATSTKASVSVPTMAIVTRSLRT